MIVCMMDAVAGSVEDRGDGREQERRDSGGELDASTRLTDVCHVSCCKFDSHRGQAFQAEDTTVILLLTLTKLS